MFFSVVDRLTAHFDCRYEDLSELMKEEEKKKYVEHLMATYDCTVRLGDKVYGVHFAGLTRLPTNKIFCHRHGLMLDEEYRHNFEIELLHPDLPCVISDDPNGITYYFPLEIIETGSLA